MATTHLLSLSLLSLSLLGTGCVGEAPGNIVGSDGTEEPAGPGEKPDGEEPDETPPGGEEAVGLVGNVTQDLSLSGQVLLTADATIAAGVTVTIEAGSQVTASEGVTLTVRGTLNVLGTNAARVSMHPSTGALQPNDSLVSAWSGVVVEAGGAANLNHIEGSGVATLLYCKAGAAQCALEGVHFNTVGNFVVAEAATSITSSSIETLGTISLRGQGSLSIVDSRIFNSQHDIIVANGGSLVIDHSEIGGAMGSYEHCNLHIGSASSVSVTNSNITSAVYGLMIGGVDGAVFNNNNFSLNETGDVLEVGTVSNVNLTGNYWDGGAPGDLSGAYDLSNTKASPVVGAGPRVAL